MVAHIPIEPGCTFGRLTVIERTSNSKHGAATYTCRCECGNTTTYLAASIKTGNTRSCGCLRRDNLRHRNLHHGNLHHGNTTHGESKTPLYAVWNAINQRCLKPHHRFYHYYGGRGISICQEWQSDFTKFRDWALANGYAPKLSIDRINVNGNYNPANCRWATRKEQIANTRPQLLYRKILILRMICT